MHIALGESTGRKPGGWTWRSGWCVRADCLAHWPNLPNRRVRDPHDVGGGSREASTYPEWAAAVIREPELLTCKRSGEWRER